eukprot:5413366-Pleurochrysis_carterae.AAC.1
MRKSSAAFRCVAGVTSTPVRRSCEPSAGPSLRVGTISTLGDSLGDADDAKFWPSISLRAISGLSVGTDDASADGSDVHDGVDDVEHVGDDVSDGSEDFDEERGMCGENGCAMDGDDGDGGDGKGEIVDGLASISGSRCSLLGWVGDEFMPCKSALIWRNVRVRLP